MRPRKSDTGAVEPWQAPTITQLPIGKETRSAEGKASAELTVPQPPPAPSSKLGFSFEMAFPLSARVGK